LQAFFRSELESYQRQANRLGINVGVVTNDRLDPFRQPTRPAGHSGVAQLSLLVLAHERRIDPTDI
jgi:hypothetical protein